MMTPASSGDGQAAGMNQSMTLMFPLMMGWFSLTFSIGLSFYFIISNVIGIVTQGFISGWEGLLFWKGFSLSSLLGGGAARQQKTQEVVTNPAESQKRSTSGTKQPRKKKRRRKR